MTVRVHNFNAGPSALPLPVLQKAQTELVDFRGAGMSIMEMSHRGKEYDAVHNEAIALFKELFAVPADYDILFLQGGASLQFAMVPMNFLAPGKKAGYVMTGAWSEKAYAEAKLFGEVFEAASAKGGNYSHIPAAADPELVSSRARTWPSMLPWMRAKVTKTRFVAFSISSTPMKTMIALRRVSTVAPPIANRIVAR